MHCVRALQNSWLNRSQLCHIDARRSHCDSHSLPRTFSLNLSPVLRPSHDRFFKGTRGVSTAPSTDACGRTATQCGQHHNTDRPATDDCGCEHDSDDFRQIGSRALCEEEWSVPGALRRPGIQVVEPLDCVHANAERRTKRDWLAELQLRVLRAFPRSAGPSDGGLAIQRTPGVRSGIVGTLQIDRHILRTDSSIPGQLPAAPPPSIVGSNPGSLPRHQTDRATGQQNDKHCVVSSAASPHRGVPSVRTSDRAGSDVQAVRSLRPRQLFHAPDLPVCDGDADCAQKGSKVTIRFIYNFWAP